MSEDEFEAELQALIDRARGAGTIPLEHLIGVMNAVTAGLEMAAGDGEAW